MTPDPKSRSSTLQMPTHSANETTANGIRQKLWTVFPRIHVSDQTYLGAHLCGHLIWYFQKVFLKLTSIFQQICQSGVLKKPPSETTQLTPMWRKTRQHAHNSASPGSWPTFLS